MASVYLIGLYMTGFGRRPDASFKAMAGETVEGVLHDAGLAHGCDIDGIWFANSGMGSAGQASIRGQAALSLLFDSARLRVGTPVVNVENACASASTALYGACGDILSGRSRLVMALGLEKLPPSLKGEADKAEVLRSFRAGADVLEPERWTDYFKDVAAALGTSFELGPGRSPFMDTYALQARWAMRERGLKVEHLAAAAAKAHDMGALNPKAQYRFVMTPEEVLADRIVSAPLTRAMCAPLSDGAAGALLCDEATLRALDERVRARALKVRACAMEGGHYREPDAPGLIERLAERVFAGRGFGAGDIDVAEIHDATSYGEIHIPEALGLCARGEAGPLALAGETRPGGMAPINPSGGMVARGHPVGATGLAMIFELGAQLRGEAGERQTRAPALALAYNGGGSMGFDEAIGLVTVLERAG